MELQQLRYFRAVAESEHMTQAAKRLFVSQSALSRAISQLEQELGVALFHRQGRSILLSIAGRRFLAAIIPVQNALDGAARTVKTCTDVDTGTIVCGFIGSLGAEVIPRLIEGFRRQWPKVQFTLIQRSGEALLNLLLDGSLDLCLSMPGAFDDPSLTWQRLTEEKLILAVSKNHRFAARKTVSLKEFRDDAFLALSAGRTLRIVFDEACKTAEFIPHVAFEAMDLTTMRGLAAVGLGVAVLPSSTSRVRGLVELKLSQPRPVRVIGIARVAGRYLPPCAENFLTFAGNLFASDRRQVARAGKRHEQS